LRHPGRAGCLDIARIRAPALNVHGTIESEVPINMQNRVEKVLHRPKESRSRAGAIDPNAGIGDGNRPLSDDFDLTVDFEGEALPEELRPARAEHPRPVELNLNRLHDGIALEHEFGHIWRFNPHGSRSLAGFSNANPLLPLGQSKVIAAFRDAGFKPGNPQVPQLDIREKDS